VANLSKTLHINFYQNRSSIVEVMTTKLVVFMRHSVEVVVVAIRPLRLLAGTLLHKKFGYIRLHLYLRQAEETINKHNILEQLSACSSLSRCIVSKVPVTQSHKLFDNV